ncbi:MAG: S8 family serine peptidase [Calothrix sp. MO_192.B10]|nr:S8 family serine peptidase [Calothrix sp. MO_192.B10]
MQINGFMASTSNENTDGISANVGQPENHRDAMPSLEMNHSLPFQRQMPRGDMNASSKANLQKVLVELRVPKTIGILGATQVIARMNVSGFQLDTSYEPIAIQPTASQVLSLETAQEQTVIVRGVIEESQIPKLEARADVVKVYKDTQIAPFDIALLEKTKPASLKLINSTSNCPIGTCDCEPTTPKGAIADVAKYLGVDKIWADGYKGEGIVIGVVDGGITAEGRPVAPFETPRRIPNVIDGPDDDWGTTARAWGEHGNMCATDVLGMAPEARLYDCRLAGGDAISNAIKAFDWSIQRHRVDGTPHILTNSWGIYQKSWDDFYATNPDHPFTRKVVEAIEAGILVLFAAGNCGESCPTDRCGSDVGPGKSIWGANGHPLVMTVGAVNKEEQFIGYSSQGPAALDPDKPDFCSISHFRGYFGSDNGTSAATPIAAGAIALFKQAKSSLTQEEVKNALKSTAKDIGESGFERHSGAGIIQVKAAFDLLQPQRPKWSPWETLGGNSFSAPAVASWDENRLDTFILGGDSAVYRKSWYRKSLDESVWTDWENLGGFSLSAPAAISRQENCIDIFIIGQQRQLLRKTWDGSAWSDWEDLGGFCKQGIAVSSWDENRLDVFTIGADNAVWHISWDGTSWSKEWESLGGFSLSAPTAVSWGDNHIEVFVRGNDHAIYRKYWDGTSWSKEWESLGGLWLYSPAVTSWGPNRLDVFAVGTDNAVHWNYWNGTSWSDWQSLSGSAISSPAAVSWGEHHIETVIVGGDNALYHKSYGEKE